MADFEKEVLGNVYQSGSNDKKEESGLGIIAKNVWFFASLMLLIPIITLFVLLILHRRVRQNGMKV